ncbi:TRAP transporter small permease [Rhodobacter sp. 24-YEA-8]|uniref:TRAP transporter small permease n=1 Tax=Rhodobacter sp. 24-YEA-8 TaxID=1884310 RepID=UPI0008991D45|nr:TRAP transporter small permease [Rhodobacter sp. 24-YEA-8]SED46504.1 TRAP-type C4-dicarboxylate transport system, small permease component [Rhodobacter sp. 24-YEA-8]
MTTASAAASWLDRFESGLVRIIAIFAILILISIVGIVFIAVVMRYGFNLALVSSFDVSTLLFAWLIFLGLVMAERDGAHMGIDITDMLPPRLHRMVVFIRYALLLAAACYLCRIGIALVERTGTQIPSLRISTRWLYAALPVGFGLLATAYVIRLARLLLSPARKA